MRIYTTTFARGLLKEDVIYLSKFYHEKDTLTTFEEKVFKGEDDATRKKKKQTVNIVFRRFIRLNSPELIYKLKDTSNDLLQTGVALFMMMYDSELVYAFYKEVIAPLLKEEREVTLLDDDLKQMMARFEREDPWLKHWDPHTFYLAERALIRSLKQIGMAKTEKGAVYLKKIVLPDPLLEYLIEREEEELYELFS